ncbi:MAG: Trk system potassium transporter TrkA [Planctomycetes bacterium]|nr:Trk system potassium transporter TrkA [Planctomycetota bacterium]
MQIIIVGAGAVGYNLADHLSKDGHNVSVIDSNPEMIERVKDRLDCDAFLGEGTSPATLKVAGIKVADIMIAVTNNDEVNIVSSIIASKFQVPTRIARVRNFELTKDSSIVPPSDFGATRLINPDELSVETLIRLIEAKHASLVADFAGGEILVREYRLKSGSWLVGKTIEAANQQAKKDFGMNFLVISIKADGKSYRPNARQDHFRDGDIVTVVLTKDDSEKFIRLIDEKPKPVDTIAIYGATSIAINAARRIAEEMNVKEIELIIPNPRDAERAADRLPGKVRVLRGQPEDPEIATDVRYEDTDFFCALSANDDRNLAAALYARQKGTTRRLILANQAELQQILNSVDIGAVVNPQIETVGSILQYFRKGSVNKVKLIHETHEECVETIVEKGARIIGRKIKDVGLPRGTLVGAYVRAGKASIVEGDTVLEEGDRVLVYTKEETIESAMAVFGRKRTTIFTK